MSRIGVCVVGCAITMGLWACEPGSVTDARDQLGRNASGSLQFVLPLVDTSYTISEFLADDVDTTTTATGLLGVRIEADTIDAVRFDEQLVTTQVSTGIGFSSMAALMAGPTDTLRFTTPQGTSVLAASVDSGYVVRSVANNSGCDATLQVSVTDSTGQTVVTLPDIAVPDGAGVLDSANAGGAVLAGFAVIGASVSFGACIPGLPGASVAITHRPMRLNSVTLGAGTESVSVEDAREVPRSNLQLGDLEDAILGSVLHDATITLDVTNTADMPIVLSNTVVGVAPVEANGMVKREPGGAIAFEVDSVGNPLTVAMADSGQSTLSIVRQGTTSVTLQAGQVVDRLVDRLLMDQRMAVVIAGDGAAGGTAPGTLSASDLVRVVYDVVMGLDVTIPAAGVAIDRTETSEGLGLNPTDRADVQARLETAVLSADVNNRTPFGVELEVAVVEGTLAPDTDVFTEPGAVILDPVVVNSPQVDGSGVIMGMASDTVSLSIDGSDVHVLLGDSYTAGVRFRLVPRQGGGTRGAFRPDDGVDIDARIRVDLRRGN